VARQQTQDGQALCAWDHHWVFLKGMLNKQIQVSGSIATHCLYLDTNKTLRKLLIIMQWPKLKVAHTSHVSVVWDKTMPGHTSGHTQ
jgi:hypothetical protein